MEKKIHKILACVDLSEYSFITLEHALEFARSTESEVVILNVINQRDITGLEMGVAYFPGYFVENIDTEEYINGVRNERHEKLKKFINDNFANEKSITQIKIDLGIPSECILKTVETDHIDLIVMANKGRGNLSRFLFGSVAEKVFRHSPIPVVSVRDKKAFKRTK